ncbi:tyrosine-type recombinase/integrase [Flavobacterium oreochromis]|nr:tyrosine-type recombinase/integrase [Flavobacterium oreochromis]QYS87217.1 tyrosine-type recombinase/integrase [Flavobacterium oreochromis]
MVVHHQIIVAHLLEYKNYLQLKGYKTQTVKHSIAYVKEYLEYQNKEPCTLSQYFKYLENRPNKNHPKLKLGKSTLNGVILALEKYFNYLEFVKKQPIIPCKVPYYKFTRKQIEYLTVKEVQKLFDCVIDLPHKAVLTCLYHLGLRASEVINLKTKDIDLKRTWYLLQDQKQDISGMYPLIKPLNKYLEIT